MKTELNKDNTCDECRACAIEGGPLSWNFVRLIIFGHLASQLLMVIALVSASDLLPDEWEFPYLFGLVAGFLVHGIYTWASVRGPFVAAMTSHRRNGRHVVLSLLFIGAVVVGATAYPRGIESTVFCAGIIIAVVLLELHRIAENKIVLYMLIKKMEKGKVKECSAQSVKEQPQ